MSPLNAPSVLPLPICGVVPLSTVAPLAVIAPFTISVPDFTQKRAVGLPERFIVAPTIQSPLLVTLFRPLMLLPAYPLRQNQIIVGAGAVVVVGNAAGYLRTGIEG